MTSWMARSANPGSARASGPDCQEMAATGNAHPSEMARVLSAALDDEALRELASRLLPYLEVREVPESPNHRLLTAADAAERAGVNARDRPPRDPRRPAASRRSHRTIAATHGTCDRCLVSEDWSNTASIWPPSSTLPAAGSTARFFLITGSRRMIEAEICDGDTKANPQRRPGALEFSMAIQALSRPHLRSRARRPESQR